MIQMMMRQISAADLIRHIDSVAPGTQIASHAGKDFVMKVFAELGGHA